VDEVMTPEGLAEKRPPPLHRPIGIPDVLVGRNSFRRSLSG
jgi:hypothetical protein